MVVVPLEIRLLTLSPDDYNAFAKVNNRLLNPPTPLKSVPLRIYIPSTPNNDSASAEYKVMQTLMPPRTSNRKQTPSFPNVSPRVHRLESLPLGSQGFSRPSALLCGLFCRPCFPVVATLCWQMSSCTAQQSPCRLPSRSS